MLFERYYPLIESESVSGLAHITGGGLLGNIGRLLSGGLRADIDWESWEWLPVFSYMQQTGNVSDDEMRHVFNLGIGITIIASPENAERITAGFDIAGAEYSIIGRITQQ